MPEGGFSTPPGPALSNANPAANGSASPGTSPMASRADHVHPSSAPAVFAFGAPTSRALSLATAYQATTAGSAAVVTVNLSSTAALSLSGGTTNTADIVIGSTNAVASGTGTIIGRYANTNTGALTIGLNLSTTSASAYTFALPANWYFAIRQTAGTVTIASAFDQVVG